MATYPPLNTSFPNPTDVDAFAHPSRDIEGYGATTLTTGVYAAAPMCGPAAVHNLATPMAPGIANYTGTAPTQTPAQPQPVDPAFL